MTHEVMSFLPLSELVAGRHFRDNYSFLLRVVVDRVC